MSFPAGDQHLEVSVADAIEGAVDLDHVVSLSAVPVACPMGRETRGNSGEARGTRSVS
jgi:hypothetical protein